MDTNFICVIRLFLHLFANLILIQERLLFAAQSAFEDQKSMQPIHTTTLSHHVPIIQTTNLVI